MSKKLIPNDQDVDRDKRVIGLYGEMRLSMELHKHGWQVYRAYIDEKFDFVIMKCYCNACQDYTNALKRNKVVTNLCEKCQGDTLRMLIRFIQVKTSEGKPLANSTIKDYSFHPKIRYHLADGRVYYAWIQIWDEDNINFFIFHTSEVDSFDNIQLPSYQTTDNQQTHLKISKDGKISYGGKYDYSVFERGRNNFQIFDELKEDEKNWKPENN